MFGVGWVVGRGRAGDELGEAQFLRLGQRRSGARAQTERREHVPDPVHDVVEERFAGFGGVRGRAVAAEQRFGERVAAGRLTALPQNVAVAHGRSRRDE